MAFKNPFQRNKGTGSMNPYWQEGMQDRAVEATQPREQQRPYASIGWGGSAIDLFNQVQSVDFMELFPEQTSSHSAANLQMKGAPAETTGLSDFETGTGLSMMDKIHLGLAAVGIGSTGWAEPVGFVADIADLALYALEGDLWGAGLAGVATVPFVGTKANISKLNKIQRKLYDSKDFAKAGKLSNTIDAMKNPVVANELSIRMQDKWVRAAFDQGKALFKAGDMVAANKMFNHMERYSPGIKDGFLSYAEYQAKITRSLGDVLSPEQMGKVFYGTEDWAKMTYKSKFTPKQIEALKRASYPDAKPVLSRSSAELQKSSVDYSKLSPSGRPGGATFANLMRLMKSEDEIQKINMPNRMPNIENIGY